MDKTTLSILVTNYNTWPLTIKCIDKCFEYADSEINKFVVVDDNSSNKLQSNIRANVSILSNERNLGLVRSLNLGLKKIDSDLIIIFDSDAWPLEPYVNKVKNYFKNNPQVGIATFNTFNEQGMISASHEPEPSTLSILLGQQLYSIYQKYFSKYSDKITVYTCTMVIRKQVLDTIGYFDENFDWLELDHDICMRATRAGWHLGIMPISAFHKGGGTYQKMSKRVIRFYKNRLYLLKKFNKYRYKYLFNIIVLSRLSLEWLMLFLLKKIHYKYENTLDKLYSRKELIKFFIKEMY